MLRMQQGRKDRCWGEVAVKECSDVTTREVNSCLTFAAASAPVGATTSVPTTGAAVVTDAAVAAGAAAAVFGSC